jgi:hypothetical protein
MSESESEDEILDRIEAALRKIAGVSVAGRRPETSEVQERAALVEKLDNIIARLREGLGASARENSGAHLREDLNAPARDELGNPRSEPGE